MLLLRGTIVYDLFFLFGQFAEGHICAHAHRPADVCHQGPHQRVPGSDGALVDGERFVGHKGRAVHCADSPRAVAGAAGALAVEGEFFCGRRIKVSAAFRAGQLLTRRDSKCGRVIVSVRAPVAGKPGVHEAETVEELGPCAECAADPGDSRALVEGKGSGDIQNVVHVSLRRLGHAPPCISGEGVQISPGAFRVEDTQGEGRFAGAGYTGDADDLPERDVHVNVFQIVDPRAADQHFIDHIRSFHRAMELLPPAHV